MTTETGTTQSETSSVPWWLILIEGIAAIIVGILLLANPGSTLAVLVRLLGIYFFVTGILSIISIFIDSTAWGWKLFAGIIGILAGFIIIEHPLWSTLLVPTTFVLVIAVFAIIIGLINLVHAFQGAGWGKGVLGVLSILLGVILLARPILATISLPLVLGVLGIAGGVLALFSAFRLKREAESKASLAAEATQVQKESEVEEISPEEVPPAPVAETAPDPDLEFLGLSNLEDLEKFKQSLEYIEGIGPIYAGKLAAIGVQTPLDLLRQGSTPKGRAEISTQSEISSSLILEWINQIDLYRVKGVGSEYADLLEASGVDTVVELAQRNPHNLFQKMTELNEEKQLVRRLPAQSQIDEWVAQAKNLPRVIQY
ncbi:MAG: DUF4332 domain-containing protein [Chloroflexi bacterium]|nr:DUF4332 domain-containing protein [Chloroflexota bacterium]